MRAHSRIGRALALAAGFAVAAVAGAQTPPSRRRRSRPPAKAAKPAKKAAATDFKMILEPRAMDLLKATSARLAAAKSMSFTATVGYEYPSKLGPPIVYTSRYDVTMQRPDKLRIMMPGDGPASEFYYDGKTMIAYRAGGEPGRGRRRAADDRRGAEGRRTTRRRSSIRSPTCWFRTRMRR